MIRPRRLFITMIFLLDYRHRLEGDYTLDRQVCLVRQRAGEVRGRELVGEKGHVADEVGAPLVEEGALREHWSANGEGSEL